MQVYVGLLAELDLQAEPLRWMGPARFDVTSVWMILRKQAHLLECQVPVGVREKGLKGTHFINVQKHQEKAFFSVKLPGN